MMNLVKNACPSCGKRGGLGPVKEFGKEKVPGSFCNRCSWFSADKQSRTREASCESCKKPLGPVAELVDVLVDGKLIHRGEAPKKLMCPGCSKKRVEAGKHDPDEIHTRHETRCMGGCGNVQGWVDTTEGNENVDLAVGYCKSCTPKAVEVTLNNKTIDDLVSKVFGTS